MQPAALALLQRTTYGTNGIRYTQTGQDQKLSHLYNPLFFHLYQQNELVGIYCLDGREVALTGTQHLSAYYGRYLAIDEQHKGKGYGHLLKSQAIAYIEQKTHNAHLYYSYVEEKNSRSIRISQAEGFVSIAMLSTYIFRRYSPHIDSRFRPARADELPTITKLLEQAYAPYALCSLGRVGYRGNYFVLQEGNELVAGIQANPVRWQFAQMPGLSGWLTMNLLPRTSITRRFFDPANYTFVVLEGLYLRPGREEQLPLLLESVLAHFRLHSALWQLDEKDPIRALLSNQSMGLLSGYQKGVRTHVLVKPVNISLDQLAIGAPVYVSSFDFA
ncbi:GNAT family N-acetyltransferase [Spirosoma pomorum]